MPSIQDGSGDRVNRQTFRKRTRPLMDLEEMSRLVAQGESERLEFKKTTDGFEAGQSTEVLTLWPMTMAMAGTCGSSSV